MSRASAKDLYPDNWESVIDWITSQPEVFDARNGEFTGYGKYLVELDPPLDVYGHPTIYLTESGIEYVKRGLHA